MMRYKYTKELYSLNKYHNNSNCGSLCMYDILFAALIMTSLYCCNGPKQILHYQTIETIDMNII